jgi:AcrR family transcriptional regulator
LNTVQYTEYRERVKLSEGGVFVGDGKPRDRILEATIGLLLENKDFDALTVRAIAERAEVGVGLINYHFADKEGLVRLAVRTFVGREIVKGYGSRDFAAASERERAILALRGPMDFLASFPGLSRVSVLYDFSSPASGDNSDGTFGELSRAFEAIAPESCRDPGFRSRLWAALGAIHEAFLRPELFRERTGLDFGEADGRAAYAEILAGLVLGAAPGKGRP